MARVYFDGNEINKTYLGSNKVMLERSNISSPPPLIVNSNLRYQWDINEAGSTSTVWADQISGSNLDAGGDTLPVYTAPDFINSGYYYIDVVDPTTNREYFYGDGVDLYSIYSQTFQRTFQWWMKMDNTSPTDCFAFFGLYANGPGSNGTPNFEFCIDPDVVGGNGPGVKMIGGNTATTTATLPYTFAPTSSLIEGEWANYAITWNHPTAGLNTTHSIEMFANGVSIGTWEGEFDNDQTTTTGFEHWMVGAQIKPTGLSPKFNMIQTSISQLLIYDTVLSNNQITQNYQATGYRYNRL